MSTDIGTVKATRPDRGFAFIRPDYNSGSEDIFAHFREFERSGLKHPEVGERYSFTIKVTPKGPQAEDIKAVL